MRRQRSESVRRPTDALQRGRPPRVVPAGSRAATGSPTCTVGRRVHRAADAVAGPRWGRSEERRVGKECWWRGWRYDDRRIVASAGLALTGAEWGIGGVWDSG